MRANHWLTALVDQYGGLAVEEAARAVLEFPAAMVGTANEAVAVSEYLQSQHGSN